MSKFDIEVTRRGDTVEVHIDTGALVEQSVCVFPFRRNCELDAELLSKHINRELRNRLEAIRRNAYKAGWKDAKAKKGSKANKFSASFQAEYYGWTD